MNCFQKKVVGVMSQDLQPTLKNTSALQANSHDTSLDLFKGVLVGGMVAAHIVQFFPSGGTVSESFSAYINLITFSGFMFVFGCTCSIAYLFKRISYSLLAKKLLKGFVRTIIAFYVSGIAFTILVAERWSATSIIEILTLQNIPGYSEFLLSFAFIFPLLFVMKPFAEKLNGVICAIVVVLSLLSCNLQFDTHFLPVLGVFFGGNAFFCFPIISYFSYFVVGAYLSKKKTSLNRIVLVFAAVGSMMLLAYIWRTGGMPTRFPPSALWVMGGYLFVYAYWLMCRNVKRWKLIKMIEAVGSKSLQYLVVSNVVIFSVFQVCSQAGGFDVSGAMTLVFWLAVFAVCIVCSFAFVRSWERLRRTMRRGIGRKERKGSHEQSVAEEAQSSGMEG